MLLRTLLRITNTNGYQYYDNCNRVLAENYTVGERWRTYQEYVLAGRDNLIEKLNEKGLAIIWLMQDLRRETGNAREKFGDFYAERRYYYIAFYKDKTLIVERMLDEFSHNLS